MTYQGETPKLSIIQCTSTDTSTDINQSTPVSIPWDTEMFKDDIYTHSNSTNPSQIEFNKEGRYELSVNLSFDSSGNPRVNPLISFRKNGSTYLEGEGLSGYIRDYDGHNESSISLRRVAVLTSGDYIEVMSEQAASTGTITLRGSESIILIKRIG